MRILTLLAQPDLVLKRPVISSDGMPLVGAGTRLSHRHLRLIHDEGITLLHVEPDPRIAAWQELPDVNGYIQRLDERFAFVEDDSLMMVMKQAVKNVYLEFLFEMED